jgi:hypothetical protein
MDFEPNYPLVRFTLRRRKWFVPIAVLLPIALALLLTWPAPTWQSVLLGVVAGAIAGFAVRSYLEVLQIIADTLLPR